MSFLYANTSNGLSTFKPTKIRYFTPLEVMLKTQIKHNSVKIVGYDFGKNYASIKYTFEDEEFIHNFSYSSITKRFQCLLYDGTKEVGILSQFELFKMMYRWHFDLLGLINNGVALDINEIK